MNTRLEFYLSQLGKYCFINEQIPYKGHYIDNTIHPSYGKAQLEMEKKENNWKNLLIELRKNKQYKIRICNSNLHSYTGLLTYNGGNEGIIFSVSPIFRVYGFCFAKILVENKTPPYKELISFTPLDNFMGEIKNKIASQIDNFFPKMEELGTQFAEYKIDKIVIAHMMHKNVNLWQVFFSTILHGII